MVGLRYHEYVIIWIRYLDGGAIHSVVDISGSIRYELARIEVWAYRVRNAKTPAGSCTLLLSSKNII